MRDPGSIKYRDSSLGLTSPHPNDMHLDQFNHFFARLTLVTLQQTDTYTDHATSDTTRLAVDRIPCESFREGLWNHRHTFVCLLPR